MNEQALKLKLMKQIKQEFPGALVWKLADKFAAGRPDLLIMYQGRAVFLELKRKGEKPTKLQDFVLQELLSAQVGMTASWTNNVEDAMNFLRFAFHIKEGR